MPVNILSSLMMNDPFFESIVSRERLTRQGNICICWVVLQLYPQACLVILGPAYRKAANTHHANGRSSDASLFKMFLK